MRKSIYASAMDLLFPRKCVFCGKILAEHEKSICPACLKDLPCRPDTERIIDADGFPCAAMFYYEEPVCSGIRALKFYHTPARAELLGGCTAKAASLSFPGKFDVVTYAPVGGLRRIKRGYNQAQLIAEAAARNLAVPVEKTLRKKRNNPAQTSVKSREARIANVRGVYEILPEADISGRRFLLIDDVCTTGSTLAACAGALMAAGAASVVCAVPAGGHRNRQNGRPKSSNIDEIY